MRMATQAQKNAAAAAQAELNEINAASGNLGQQIFNNSEYQAAFKKKDGSVYTLAELDSVSLLSDAEAYAKSAFILSRTRSGLEAAMAEAAKKGTTVFINGASVPAGADPLAGITKLEQLNGINVGPDPAYIARLQAIIDAGNAPDPVVVTPTRATTAIRTTTFIPTTAPVARPSSAPIATPSVVSTPSLPHGEPKAFTTTSLPIQIATTSAAPTSTPSALPQADEVITLQNNTFVTRQNDAGTTIVTTSKVETIATVPRSATLAPTLTAPRQTSATSTPTRAAPTQAATAAAPFSMGRITPQTTVLDLIVNGIQTSSDPEAALLRKTATDKLTDELKKTKLELANNPQALEAAVRQGLPVSIRGLVVALSADKAVQQKIANGFLDGMRRESPGAEHSSFYKHLKTLSSEPATFNAFLNANMLDGISRDYEARIRAENNGQVPHRVSDAVAANIMRVKPEIKKYNDQVGQDIHDFVRNPEISRQRLLQSPKTQAEIRAGLAQYKKDHPFQTFFAGMFGVNMEQRAQEEARKRIAREVRNKNYSHEIQSGFVDELNRRTEGELRGEQLANMRAFTRYLGHLPYSRFIQEDISPRRISSIILGIEQPGEQNAPSRHLIPPQLVSRAQNPYVNVAATPTQPLPMQPHGSPSRAPSPQSAA